MKIRRKNTFCTCRGPCVSMMVVISLLSTSFLVSSSPVEMSVSETYSFVQPNVVKVQIDDEVYDRVLYSNAPGYGAVGAPKLPAYSVRLLLPQGCRMGDISVDTGTYRSLGRGFSVEPVQTPMKLSELYSGSENSEYVEKSPVTAMQDLYSVVGTYWFRGYQILALLLHPVVYDTETGELGYYEDITVDVSVTHDNSISPLFRGSSTDQIEVCAKVDNPVISTTYDELMHNSGDEGYDLLILTTSEYASAFQPLKQAHTLQGLVTEIKTLKDISLFPNQVTAEDIRAFLRQEFLNQGVEYVLLGGDTNKIPAKQLWVQAWQNGESTLMPSDLYYACLDGTYNYDDDDRWGEPTDGENGADVDLLAEVYVGRASVGSITEVQFFVDKTVSYLNNDGFSSDKVYMVGEYLWSNPDTWGGDYMDELINQSNENMYQTMGIPENHYVISKIYDRDWENNYWPKSTIINRINQGVAIVNHLGHSGPDYNMKLGNNDVAQLSNVDPFFYYSQGCTAGAFDHEDCIAEYFTVKTENAAFAAIMNARYGWGVKGSTDGPNQRYHREFWDAIFGEDITAIGKANQDSKEDSLALIDGACMRWCYYQLNLFGDPALQLISSDNTVPETPGKPRLVQQGKIGEESTFAASATDPDGDKLYFKWDFGDGTTSDWIGPHDSGEEITIFHVYERRGFYQIKVRARDSHLSLSEWSDTLPVRLTVFSEFPLLNFIFQILQDFFPQLAQ